MFCRLQMSSKCPRYFLAEVNVFKTKIVVASFLFWVASLQAGDLLPGIGYDSQLNTSKESPLESISFSYGNACATLAFRMKMHSQRQTKDILVESGTVIGCLLLGADLTGALRDRLAASREFFSCELLCESSQQIRLNRFSRRADLGTGTVQWSNEEFRNRFGDSILWSLKKGGKLKVTIVASCERHLSSTEVNFEAKVNALFTSFIVAKIHHSSSEFSEKFDFSAYFLQEGGTNVGKTNFIEANQFHSIADFEKCQNLVRALSAYAFGNRSEDYPAQIRSQPATWEHEYISYGDENLISFIWEPI